MHDESRISQMLIQSARAADDMKIPFGTPAVQAGRALAALPSVDDAIKHAEQVVAHLRVLKGEESADVCTTPARAAE